jgi:hypothetical protein
LSPDNDLRQRGEFAALPYLRRICSVWDAFHPRDWMAGQDNQNFGVRMALIERR